jgi:hypothetical protein
MPRETDPHWIEKIKSIKANNPSWGAGRILAAMGQEAAKSEVAYLGPSEPTIRRILRREWDPLDEERKNQYLDFYWPESMERGDLPWEAGASGLELLRQDPVERPSVRYVKWFWRVTQIMPKHDGAPPEKYFALRNAIALILTLRDRVDLLPHFPPSQTARSTGDAFNWDNFIPSATARSIEDAITWGVSTAELQQMLELLSRSYLPELIHKLRDALDEGKASKTITAEGDTDEQERQ